MASRLQEHHKGRPRDGEHATTRGASQTGTRATRGAEDLKHELDDLLDDIDAVLEENAEEFVTAFVQRGGQ
jgi:ubiquitin-like protein Pup